MISVQTANAKITEKFASVTLAYDQLKSIATLYTAMSIPYEKKLAVCCVPVNIAADEILTLEKDYHAMVAPVLIEYYMHVYSASEDFQRIVDSGGFVPKLDEYITVAERIIDLMTAEYMRAQPPVDSLGRRRVISKTAKAVPDGPVAVLFGRVQTHLSAARNTVVKYETTRSRADVCKLCGERMVMSNVVSEMVCLSVVCGGTESIHGTAVEDIGLIGRGENGRVNKYSPAKYCAFWLEHLQAKETKVFPPEELDMMRRIISRDRLELNVVGEMRAVLKELKLTKYNDHAPKLMFIFTGRMPPQFTFTQQRRITAKVNRAGEAIMEIYAETNEKQNRPYYPYFIYKIVEDEAAAAAKRGERELSREFRRFLSYIHLQSDDTVRAHDALYKEVCLRCSTDEDVPADEQLNYTPTI